MQASVVITGIKDIDRRLKNLPLKIQKKVVRQAMRKGLKIMAAEIRAQAPVDTGLTRSAVKVRATKSRKRGSISLEVRISGKTPGLVKFTKAGKRFFYPAIVEYKHNPFMHRVFAAKGELVRQQTIEEIRLGIEREANTP